MPPATRSSTSKPTSPSLKQSRLSFASTKRTASGKSKGKKPTPSRTTSTSSIIRVDDSSEDDSSQSEVPVKAPLPKRRRTGVTEDVARMKIAEGTEEEGAAEAEVMDLQDRKGRWRKYYGTVREKMGNLEPIHAQGQTKIHHILRVFDLSYEYGPCIGVTRLERWERAQALGLNPPPEVREILLTKQGLEEDQFRETVFYGEA
ncbi:hypothetical protein GLOTRDRAFT_74608 [Gloeophyllum trabeum ATCC 11539]|uniref:DNA polymerase delta subunit 4 n=1 Tax=Gloeophyllum trabeum (strain ATCC 11539 / FP-39264 / Madison 617) TaxID=670483 RepID=S7Q9A8_GLOTA|nr:uncharacterized protein GLOTRDRAFT_74608 [Gloeophyllum trabeum ATCC 11539]EPQ56102.1 hypothetical protein GLOTRDRAFT_74608 [Gloeophyllum trabeum ATCC 11539]